MIGREKWLKQRCQNNNILSHMPFNKRWLMQELSHEAGFFNVFSFTFKGLPSIQASKDYIQIRD